MTAMKEQTSVCLETMNRSETEVYPDEEKCNSLSYYVRLLEKNLISSFRTLLYIIFTAFATKKAANRFWQLAALNYLVLLMVKTCR